MSGIISGKISDIISGKFSDIISDIIHRVSGKIGYNLGSPAVVHRGSLLQSSGISPEGGGPPFLARGRYMYMYMIMYMYVFMY